VKRARYRFDVLVYFEAFSNPSEAIEREKEIKGWRREKKLRLILAANPDWADMTTPARENRACRGPRLSAEWVEDESWKAIPEAKIRPVLRRQPRKS
jgi:hypothetical protein